jgi:hypothetical protein
MLLSELLSVPPVKESIGEGGGGGERVAVDVLLLLLLMPIKREHRRHYQISALRQQSDKRPIVQNKSSL